MAQKRLDSFKTAQSFEVNAKKYRYFDLQKLQKQGVVQTDRLPFSLKVLLENLLRHEDGVTVKDSDILAMNQWLQDKKSDTEINYYPARVVMQDFTGVPGVVDLAAMRDAMVKMGGDPEKINPLNPVDLVIDHSVQVDAFGSKDSFKKNVDIEFKRNKERYEFLKWGQKAFKNFKVVPPGTGIVHQVNLEYLAPVVMSKQEDGELLAYCDTCVGTDSHTTMINGLAVLGWGVGGIEAEAAMLGQAVTMLIPEVVGFELTGELVEGVTATDLVLTVVEMLRKKGVVGKFVEFYGDGLANLSLADRATIANMAPEYGATCGFFPIDEKTIEYLRFSGRDEEQVQLVETYARHQGLWWEKGVKAPEFSDTLKLNMNTVVPCIAGPSKPQQKIALKDASHRFSSILDEFKVADHKKEVPVEGESYSLKHGDVVIAAITSCTNTSNPSVLIGAGLVARKALSLGLKVKPWVKTSLAPGSQVVTDYLEAAGLQSDLDDLGFNLVGYGCTTCIGNSGPLPEKIAKASEQGDLVVTSVLSGNRNFEGRINPHVKANFLASPPLVVAYALAGNLNIDILKDPIGEDAKGNRVYFQDLWPSNEEIERVLKRALNSDMFKKRYSDVFKGPKAWQEVKTSEGQTYSWDADSTYVQNPPYFVGMTPELPGVKSVKQARVLALFGDTVTTDHISPAGAIKADSPAGKYLQQKGVNIVDFNSYGSRRGNHEVMMRGTFANIRIKNEMMGGKEGGHTKYIPSAEEMSIYDAAMKYQSENTPLVVVAGKEYGTGSSRDWAAKGTLLLGVKAVIAESFERIHRSNLIGMGVIPLQFRSGESRHSFGLTGQELFDIKIPENFSPRSQVEAIITKQDGTSITAIFDSRIDTATELEYVKNGGILHYVLRDLGKK